MAFCTMLLLSLVGFVTNGTGIWMCNKMGAIRQAFCRLYLSVAVGDCGILCSFAFYVAPMVISQSPVGYHRVSMAISGAFHLMMWCVSVFSTLSLAINRYVAAAFPANYTDFYCDRNLKINIIIVWVVSFVYSIFFLLENCEFRMDPAYGVFDYARSPCGFALDIICSVFCCVVFVIIFILNVLTILKIQQRRKNQVASNYVTHENAQILKQKRQERAFLLQACINSGLFQVFTMSFHAFARIEVSLLIRFFMKTIIWQIAHLINGFVFLAVNEDIRNEVFIYLGIKKRPELSPLVTFSHIHSPKLQRSPKHHPPAIA